MFALKSIAGSQSMVRHGLLRQQHLVMVRQSTLYVAQTRQFGIFDNLFGWNKEEEKKKKEPETKVEESKEQEHVEKVEDVEEVVKEKEEVQVSSADTADAADTTQKAQEIQEAIDVEVIPEKKPFQQPKQPKKPKAMIEKVNKPKLHVTELKQQIRQMERQSDEGNMYATYEPTRLSKQQRDSDIGSLFHPSLLNHPQVKIEKYKKSKHTRGLNKTDQKVPVSPRIGPYEIKNPEFGAKNYYWCSCGMSDNQPFCDSSKHVGTGFKPLKFSLDEAIDVMHMCGCKMSSTAPFCDGKTCESIMLGKSLKKVGQKNYVVGKAEHDRRQPRERE